MRDLDHTDPYELAVIREFGGGVLVWRHDHEKSTLKDCSLLALATGEDDPQLVCVEAHTTPGGSPMIRSLAFPVTALNAKIPLLEWLPYRVDEDDVSSKVAREAAGDWFYGIWNHGSSAYHTYLGRQRTLDGWRVFTILLDRSHGPSAYVDFEISAGKLIQEARELGAGAPSP